MKAGVILFHNFGDTADALEVGLSQNGDTLKGRGRRVKTLSRYCCKILETRPGSKVFSLGSLEV